MNKLLLLLFFVVNTSFADNTVYTTDVVTVCTTKTSSIRYVSNTLRKSVYKQYGIDNSKGNYVIDHIIPLSLGGSNHITNLQPQDKITSKQKDKLEYLLNKKVCNGEISLIEAQQCIFNNWLECSSSFGDR